MATKNDYFQVTGRRKTATARVRLSGGKGTVTVNGKPATEYFAGSSYLLNKLSQPFAALDLENKYDISARVAGGGADGQAEAIRLGVAKALSAMNESLRGTLKRADLLSRDPRDKERKKYGQRGARRQRQFVKR
ncbi:MAG TPA: 30S ribosomal protein S9 [Candidatus Saccharimonadales bacterium]|nr:30S ribosomal protein S9 [Candidatus Saccharimonadales bacterium]